MSRTINTILIVMGVCLFVFAAPALADWQPSDGSKMTVPQLPDPQGMDIDMTLPRVLADDWMCSQTGPVTDVHFWISVRGNTGPAIPPSQLETLLGPLYLSFHENIPAGPTGTPPSQPGTNIRGYVLPPPAYTVNPQPFPGLQSWYDPESGLYVPDDHSWYYQVNVPTLPDPFIQQAGNIYWLDLSFDTTLPVGWKTSLDQFDERPPLGADDDAVWGIRPPGDPFGNTLPINWQSMTYPEGNPHFPQSLNMAFVITPEPASLTALLGLGALLAARRR